MYVAVKGGERAIENAHQLLAEKRRGDTSIPELSLDQISEQLGLSVARVMAEGSLHDPKLAALAIKQARASRQLIKIFRAGKSLAQPMIIHIDCWTLR
jgi:alpha-D-ribose 1-methylphosphonate 5-triphosphate synthase subunit PhnI